MYEKTMYQKTLFMLNAITNDGVSVIHIKPSPVSAEEFWAAHDKPQDGYGGHSGKWAEGPTPQDAVWNLYHHE